MEYIFLQASDYTNIVHRRHEFAQVTQKYFFCQFYPTMLTSGNLVWMINFLIRQCLHLVI